MDSKHTSCEPIRRNDEEVRIVMVGKTGIGKSATGNTILGRQCFESKISAKSMTVDCSKGKALVDGQQVAVVDTPGLFDTRFSMDKTTKDICQCISYASPGPHVFLVVIRLGRFTEEEKQTVQKIQEIFGQAADRYSMVLFTHGDVLEDTTIEEFMVGSSDLQELVSRCNGQYHVFNNKLKDGAQVTELLQKIRNIVQKNGGSHYTNEMFQEAERAIEEEKQRILKEKEEEIRKEKEELERKLQEKYEKEMKKMNALLQAEREEERKREEEERKEERKREEEEKQRIIKEKEEQMRREQKELEIKLQEKYEKELKKMNAQLQAEREEERKREEEERKLKKEEKQDILKEKDEQIHRELEELEKKLQEKYEKEMKKMNAQLQAEKEEERKREEEEGKREEEERKREREEREAGRLKEREEKEREIANMMNAIKANHNRELKEEQEKMKKIYDTLSRLQAEKQNKTPCTIL